MASIWESLSGFLGDFGGPIALAGQAASVAARKRAEKQALEGVNRAAALQWQNQQNVTAGQQQDLTAVNTARESDREAAHQANLRLIQTRADTAGQKAAYTAAERARQEDIAAKSRGQFSATVPQFDAGAVEERRKKQEADWLSMSAQPSGAGTVTQNYIANTGAGAQPKIVADSLAGSVQAALTEAQAHAQRSALAKSFGMTRGEDATTIRRSGAEQQRIGREGAASKALLPAEYSAADAQRGAVEAGIAGELAKRLPAPTPHAADDARYQGALATRAENLTPDPSIGTRTLSDILGGASQIAGLAALTKKKPPVARDFPGAGQPRKDDWLYGLVSPT